MRFLADESCDCAVVQALRADGYDVLYISEFAPGAEDSQVMRLAAREERILLTEDKDFGQLVYAHGQKTYGVIFLRFPISARKKISRDVVRLVKQRGDELAECFVTVQPGRIRLSRTSAD
jgi:predicted nuclease of predicted toxin-antitoxin system